MKSRFWLILNIVFLIAAAVLMACGLGVWTYVSLFLTFVALLMLYRTLALPMRAVSNGLDLLNSQDFASRLRPVGQRDADSIVRLFNDIMGKLKEEHLYNLEQQSFLGELIEASPMGIAICNLDGHIERTNRAFDTYCTDEVRAALDRLAADASVTLRSEGTQVFRCSRSHFMDRGFARPFFLVERLTDEIVKAENRVFHKIVRTIGHEVNNTLGGVISVLETLCDMHQGDTAVTDALSSCARSCEALGLFVKGYSDVVKLPEAVLQPVSLESMLREFEPFISGMLPSNVELRVCVDNAATVPIDTMLMQRVVINAVKNALESIGDMPGTITLCACGRRLAIIDNGPGLPPEAKKLVFTPFFSTKRPDRGLGLMLVADILRKHQARFGLATLDGLTTLYVDFPD